ncbi:MAG TPA: RNA polymerase sigma factor [Elusimicrobiales bacterium]|nr:RNA polymerase sigma factor [Elusimicrobiales bacterium]
MDAKEEALIAKAKDGDIASFEELIKLHKDRIYGLAHYVCSGLPSEAEDVYQETMLTAFTKIKSFKGRSGFGTWLYRIAANNCWMKFRRKKREKLVSLEDIKDVKDAVAHEESIKKDLSESVARALSALPVDYRMAITLVDIQEMSLEEAAKVLEITVGALKSRLLRGRLRLREEFNKK